MRKTDFDSRLLIYRSRRIFLGLSVFAMWGLFMYLIVRNNNNGYAWYVLTLPLTALGTIFLAFPMTEEWEYKPWQNKPRRVEQQER